jgi:hypothetical protein
MVWNIWLIILVPVDDYQSIAGCENELKETKGYLCGY